MSTVELDVEATNADTTYAELLKRGYDAGSIFRYAKAARSWTTRDSLEWKVWLEVEARASKEGATQ